MFVLNSKRQTIFNGRLCEKSRVLIRLSAYNDNVADRDSVDNGRLCLGQDSSNFGLDIWIKDRRGPVAVSEDLEPRKPSGEPRWHSRFMVGGLPAEFEQNISILSICFKNSRVRARQIKNT